MSKNIKLILTILFIITISFNFYFVNATSEDNDTEVEETNEIEEINDEETQPPSLLQSLDNLSQTTTGTKVTSINSYEEANLQLNNILCIILISIGFLLILFAIAILIRLKR